nr:hypothetical protein [Veillonella denticariosi]
MNQNIRYITEIAILTAMITVLGGNQNSKCYTGHRISTVCTFGGGNLRRIRI